MKHITSFKTLLSLLLMLVVGNITAAADNKVYISDFSIAAGDEVEIAVNFDTDATDIRGIDGTIALPAGLSVVQNAYGTNQLTKADETRAAGFMNNFKPSNGYFKLRGMLSSNVITGTTGAVAYIKVKADASLAATSIIKLSNFQIELADGTKAAAATENTIVTCTSAAPAANSMSADPAEIELPAGGSAEFTVSLTNEIAVTGFDAVIDLPTGVTAEVTKSARLTGAIFSYNPATKKVTYWGASAITGNEGVIFTVKLTADGTFTAPTRVILSDIHITNASSVTTGLAPVVINVAATDPFTGLINAALASVESGEAIVTLDKDYEVKSPVVVPASKQLVLDGANHTLTLGEATNFTICDGITIKNVNIDAAALTKPLVQMNGIPEIESVESGQYVIKNAITFDNVKATGLTKNLFSDNSKAYVYEQFNINNSIFEYATQTGVVLNLGSSMAINFNITNSTFWSKEAGTANFIAMSGKRPWQVTGYEEETGKMTVANSTFYNVGKSKQFMNTNTLKGQKYLYEFNSNIFVDVSNKKIYGNMTNNKKQLTTDGKNTYFFNGEFFAETNYNGDEGLQTDPSFADAAAGDFTIGAITLQAKEKTGDPRWLVEYSKGTFSALVADALAGVESGEATLKLIDDYDVDAAVTVPAGKQLVLDGANHSLTLGEATNFTICDGITIKNVNIDAAALTKPLVQMNGTPEIEPVESGQYVIKNAITFDNVKATGLTKNLFSDNSKAYVYEQFNINNSVFEYATQTGVVLNLTASMAINFNITNSTFWSKEAGTANFIAMSGKRPWQVTGYEDETGKLTVANNTFYNVAKSKQFMNTNTLKGQKYLYEFNSNIFVDVSNKKIYGNMTNNAKQLTTDGKNTYFFDGASFAETNYNGDEGLQTDPSFADATTGNFTIGESTKQAREKTGDPRWVVPFVAPTDVDKTVLAATIGVAEALVAPEETAPDNVKTAWATVTTTLATAQAVNADANVFQDEVDAANTALANAIAAYNTATGITEINIDNNTVAGEKDVYYNLQGVRVANPGKGIYIKNGKKVLVK